MRRPAGVLCRALLFDSFVKGYFVLAYTNQYPYPASSTSRRSLSLIYRDRLAISYHDHAHLLNPQRVWEQPDVVPGIWNLRNVFKAGGQMLVLVTPHGSTLRSNCSVTSW